MRLLIDIDLDEGGFSHLEIFELIRKALIVGVENATARFEIGDRGYVPGTAGQPCGDWQVVR